MLPILICQSYQHLLGFFEKILFWQDNRYSSSTFPTSLTNPRKSATYTLARRDWDDYLYIDFRRLPKEFSPETNLGI